MPALCDERHLSTEGYLLAPHGKRRQHGPYHQHSPYQQAQPVSPAQPPSRGEPYVPASLSANSLSPRIVLPGLTSVKVLTLVPLIVVPAAPTGMPVAPRVTAEAGRREEASHADHEPEEQDELDECQEHEPGARQQYHCE